MGTLCDDDNTGDLRQCQEYDYANLRINTFLNDPNGPFVFSLERQLNTRQKVQRALAEIEGLDAGLKLVKTLKKNGPDTDEACLQQVLSLSVPAANDRDASGAWCGDEDSPCLTDIPQTRGEDEKSTTSTEVGDTIVAATSPKSHSHIPETALLGCTGIQSIRNSPSLHLEPSDGQGLAWSSADRFHVQNLDTYSTEVNRIQGISDDLPSSTLSAPEAPYLPLGLEKNGPTSHFPVGGTSQRTHPPPKPSSKSGTETAALDRSTIERGVRALRRVERYYNKDHTRFLEVTQDCKDQVVLDLRSVFQDPDTWRSKGKDAWEQILAGSLVGTLAEILAFTSMSYVIAKILVEDENIHHRNILAGLHQFKNAIRDVRERELFVEIVPKMWPLPNIKDLLDGSNSYAPQRSLNIYSVPMDEVALDLAELTGENYGFSQFRQFIPQPSLTQTSSDMVHGQNGHEVDYRVADCIDPTFLSPFGGIRVDSVVNGFSPNLPLPSPCSTTPQRRPQREHVRRRYYNFDIPSNGLEMKVFDLRNTEMFLSVLAFVKEQSDFFFALSGGGKAAAYYPTKLASPIERSKTERKLRKEFFEPVKKRMGRKSNFKVLLSLAKYFVILGRLKTQADILEYLMFLSAVGPAPTLFSRPLLTGSNNIGPLRTRCGATKIQAVDHGCGPWRFGYGRYLP